MIVFLTASVVVLLGLVIAVVVFRVGGDQVHMAPSTGTAGGQELPPGEVTSDSLALVRFDRAVRGYRMDQVDEVLDRMRATLAAYEDGVPAGRPERSNPPSDSETTGWSEPDRRPPQA